MGKPSQEEAFMLHQLKEILLKEDREELEKLRDILDDPELLSARVLPIIEQRIEFLRKNFPKEFRVVVNDIVDKKLKTSQTELIDTLYPVIGQMIKKYLASQFQELKEAIDAQIKNTFGKNNILKRTKAWFFGINENDFILQNLDRPSIEEVTLIQRHSGLIMGSASLNQTVDQEAIAGMLTAIKAFVEDAFQQEKEDLEMIQYGSYKILLYNYHSYYFSVAIKGSISTSEKEKINDHLHLFAINELKNYKESELDSKNEFLSQQLRAYFIETQPTTLTVSQELEPKKQLSVAYD